MASVGHDTKDECALAVGTAVTRRRAHGTQRIAASAMMLVPSSNSQPLASASILGLLELPVERLHRPGAPPACCWMLCERDGARDGSACSYSYLDVLSLRCGSALLRYHSNLQVSRASSHALPAMHGSHCNDRASCARTAGSCSASSSTIRLATIRLCDHPHVGGALGERAELGLLSRPVESWQQPTGNGWPRAHGVGPLPGSSGDRPPTSVARMDSLVRSWCLT